MSGHSHWAGIKRKKEATDQKRGKLFSKLLNAIAIAARHEPNPQFNPRLKQAIAKAKGYSVPQDNIDRAIRRASEDKNLEELLFEVYGPEGVAMLIETITDNKNRTIPEIKKILGDHGAKWAEPGSVLWAFENAADGWTAKFPQDAQGETEEKIRALLLALEEHDDVQRVHTNTRFDNK